VPVLARVEDVAGTETHWWEYGPEPRDALATIVAVHGYRGDHHGLEAVIAQLPEFRFLSPDLPAFGDSGPLPGHHTMDAYADWLIAFLARIDGPVTVLGHSFGSIVTAAALDRGLTPERVILMNPIAAPALRGPKAIGTLTALAWYRLAGVLPERVGRQTLSAQVMVDGMSFMTTRTRERELRRWIKEEHRRYFNGFHSKRSVVEGFEASIRDNVTAHASAFTMPTLLIAAEQDQITPIAAVRRLHAAIPTSELVVLEDVGHLIHYERPRETAEAIRGFHL
jgi:pimeloyl-ACP methyl ester carboxylesterase